ncbi:MAG: hypothetical protein WCQ55_05715, partial [Paludibacteraceae bacterium]
MSLNLKGYLTLRCRSLMAVSLLLVCMTDVLAQKNVDTPNLSLENGNLQYWNQYIGGIYYDDAEGVYKYDDWNQVTNTQQI